MEQGPLVGVACCLLKLHSCNAISAGSYAGENPTEKLIPELSKLDVLVDINLLRETSRNPQANSGLYQTQTRVLSVLITRATQKEQAIQPRQKSRPPRSRDSSWLNRRQAHT